MTPWDIGGPQPVIRQLAAVGAIKGEVLEPGCGSGHHAIYCAAQGYSVTGVEISPTALDRARRNAAAAGVTVDFQLADATQLDGFEGRFDTVLDCGLFHNIPSAAWPSYMQALHRATRPGARTYMFEWAPGRLNGLSNPSPLHEEDFSAVLPRSARTSPTSRRQPGSCARTRTPPAPRRPSCACSVFVRYTRRALAVGRTTALHRQSVAGLGHANTHPSLHLALT